VLVTAVNDCNVKLAPLTLALIVPLLVNVPLLMRPAPSMVSSLDKGRLPASTLPVYGHCCWPKPASPCPSGQVRGVRRVEYVLLPVACSVMVPLLVMVPVETIWPLFCTFSVPVLVMFVRFAVLFGGDHDGPGTARG